MVLETSSDLIAADISNAVPQVEGGGPGWFSAGNGNPGMPEPVFGIKSPGNTSEIATFDFDCLRAPKWGDFYAKDGAKGGQLWNAGFTSPDTDPTVPAQNGSIAYHVLVPDTATSAVPTPASALLVGVGTSMISWLRRHRIL